MVEHLEQGNIAANSGLATPANLFELHGDTYACSLRVWGNSIGELWDPNKKDYIEVEGLPAPLMQAHKNLWEINGDDYLVEYQNNYYYMMDHIYSEHDLRSFGLDRWSELYEVALANAIEAASHEALKDTIVLVAKKSVSLGAMHVVSVLVKPEATKENVDKIREILSGCMFKMPDKALSQPSLSSLIHSAASKVAVSPTTPTCQTKTAEVEH